MAKAGPLRLRIIFIPSGSLNFHLGTASCARRRCILREFENALHVLEYLIRQLVRHYDAAVCIVHMTE